MWNRKIKLRKSNFAVQQKLLGSNWFHSTYLYKSEL